MWQLVTEYGRVGYVSSKIGSCGPTRLVSMVGLTGLDSLAVLVWCRLMFLQSWLCEAEQLCQHVEIKLRKRGRCLKIRAVIG